MTSEQLNNAMSSTSKLMAWAWWSGFFSGIVTGMILSWLILEAVTA